MKLNSKSTLVMISKAFNIIGWFILCVSGAYVCIPLVEYLLSQLNCSALEYFPILGAVIVIVANLIRDYADKMP